MVLNFLPRKRHEQFFIIIAVVMILLVAAVHPAIGPSSATNTTNLDPLNIIVQPANNTTTCPPPPKNNTTVIPPPVKQPLRIAVAGDVASFTNPVLDQLKSMGVTEVHIVVPNAGLYTDVLARIKAHGMTPVYDGEVPFWMDHNSNTAYNALELSTLKSIHDAGWEYFASEGLYAIQVNQINNIGFKYINYGGDMGENLYCNNNYGPHAKGSHYANLMESYDANLKPTITATILYQAKETPLHNGILFGLWTGSRTGGPNIALQSGGAAQYIKDLNAKGAKITTVLWWCGLTQSPLTQLNGQFQTPFNEVKALRF
jgi:hypothetical protein